MTQELKPCPFCGGEVKLEQPINKRGWGVVCRNGLNLGGTCAIEQIPSATEWAAEKRWNTRTPDPLLSEALEALKRSRQGWTNAIELGLIPPQHRNAALILADEATAILLKAQRNET